jgi:lipid-binding SYLF domain-containing protein
MGSKRKALLIIAVGLFLVSCHSQTATGPSPQQALVYKAAASLRNFSTTDGMEWFCENLHKARGLVIVPELYKGGFIVGGSGGRALFMLRDEATGDWVGPSFYTLGSGNIGFQIGGQLAEVMIMVMTQNGVENMYSSNFKLAGDASVVAGPVGVGISGSVAAVTADYLSFALAKGLYAGIALDGTVIKVNNGWNQAYYGQGVRAVDILANQSVSNPNASQLKEELVRVAKGG